ncbi:MAG: helix-turn-helix domain-containing protein [Anaerolineaceae bacterium]
MTVPPPLGVRGKDETRGRILKAAMELFGRDGFDCTTIRAIAEQCDLSDPALYYYFKTKRDILLALWDLPSPLEPMRPTTPRNMRPASPEFPMDDGVLMGLVDWMLDGSARQDSLNRLLFRSVLDGDKTAIALRETKRRGWLSVLTPYFASVFPPAELAIRLETAVMLALGFVYTAQIENGADFPKVAADPAFRAPLKQLMRLAIPLPPAGEH